MTPKKPWIGILPMTIAGLSIYFIFLGMELVGIGLLMLTAFLEYRLTRVKKMA